MRPVHFGQVRVRQVVSAAWRYNSVQLPTLMPARRRRYRVGAK
jgi:hypothetical protein